MIRSTEGKGISENIYSLVKARAYSFYITTGIPLDELESEGLLVYSICLSKWKPGNGVKFTTFLYQCLTNNYIKFCEEWRHQLPAMLIDYELPEIAYRESMERRLMFKQMIKSLSPEAQGVVALLEECADDILAMGDRDAKDPHAPKRLVGALRRFLKSIGWRAWVIDKTFKELRDCAATIS